MTTAEVVRRINVIVIIVVSSHVFAAPNGSRTDRLTACAEKAEKEKIQRKDLSAFMKECGQVEGKPQKFAPKSESSEDILEKFRANALERKVD